MRLRSTDFGRGNVALLVASEQLIDLRPRTLGREFSVCGGDPALRSIRSPLLQARTHFVNRRGGVRCSKRRMHGRQILA